MYGLYLLGLAAGAAGVKGRAHEMRASEKAGGKTHPTQSTLQKLGRRLHNAACGLIKHWRHGSSLLRRLRHAQRQGGQPWQRRQRQQSCNLQRLLRLLLQLPQQHRLLLLRLLLLEQQVQNALHLPFQALQPLVQAGVGCRRRISRAWHKRLLGGALPQQCSLLRRLLHLIL